jgi:hypothetical protein
MIVILALIGISAFAEAPSASHLTFECIAENGFQHRFTARNVNLREAQDQALEQCQSEGTRDCKILRCNPLP